MTQSLTKSVRLHIGFDLWTGTNHSHYLVCTAHWIDAEWTLHRAGLDLLPLSGQTSTDIVDTIRNSFQKFNIIEDNIASVCTDGASNEIAAATFDGFCENADHVWCLAHQLNLVVGDGYSGRCRSRDSTEKPTPIRQPKSRGNKSSRNTNAVTYLLNYLFVLISDRFKLVLRGRVELIPF